MWADLSVEMSEVAVLVAEGIWDELVHDTAHLMAVLEESQEQLMRQQQQQVAAWRGQQQWPARPSTMMPVGFA